MFLAGLERSHVDEKGTDDLSSRAYALFDSVVLSDYYGPQGRLDDAMSAVLGALTEGSCREWNSFLASLTEHHRRVLGHYAMRAPMLALRTKMARHLYTGLLAYISSNRDVRDWRDDMVFFAPFVHVATMLGRDVPALFDDAATYAIPPLASVMRTFGRRIDVTLGVFGWRQVDTPHGPSFEMMNWKSGPSGAVVGEHSWGEVNRAQLQELMDWINKQSPKHDQERTE